MRALHSSAEGSDNRCTTIQGEKMVALTTEQSESSMVSAFSAWKEFESETDTTGGGETSSAIKKERVECGEEKRAVLAK